MYTKDEIQAVFHYINPDMQLGFDAYEKICKMIEHNIVHRVCEYLRDKPLVEQEVINAYVNIVDLNQNNEINMKTQCLSALNVVVHNPHKQLLLPILRTAILFESKGLHLDEGSIIVKLLTAGIEYLLSEVIDTGCNVTQNRNRKRLMPLHIDEAIDNDVELRQVFTQ